MLSTQAEYSNRGQPGDGGWTERRDSDRYVDGSSNAGGAVFRELREAGSLQLRPAYTPAGADQRVFPSCISKGGEVAET